jgi:hypothetical protein
MKVYLGPYVHIWRCRIHSRYMDKKYKYDWPDVEDWSTYERALEKLEDGIQFVYNHTINVYLSRKKRKEKVRIDPYDVWGMDHTLALIIVPMLKLLKEKKHGHPWVDDKDVPKELRSTNAPAVKDEHEWDENSSKRWEWVLDEMIHAFECAANEEWDSQFYSGKSDLRFVPIEVDGKKFFKCESGPEDTFKVDRKGMEKAWKRRREGLRLFAKYYHNLWD